MYAHVYQNVKEPLASDVLAASDQLLNDDIDDMGAEQAFKKAARAIGIRPHNWGDIVSDLVAANRAQEIKVLAGMELFSVKSSLHLFGAAMITVHQHDLQQTYINDETINACMSLLGPIIASVTASVASGTSSLFEKVLDWARLDAVKRASIAELHTDFLSTVMDAVRLTADEFLQICRDGDGVRLSCAICGIAKFKLVNAEYPMNAPMKQAAALCRAIVASAAPVASAASVASVASARFLQHLSDAGKRIQPNFTCGSKFELKEHRDDSYVVYSFRDNLYALFDPPLENYHVIVDKV